MPQLNHEKEWILTGNQDYTPNGVLQLGQILTDYNDLNTAIYAEGTIPRPKHILKDELNSQKFYYLYESSEPKRTAFTYWLKNLSHEIIRSTIDSNLEKAYQTMFEDHTVNAISVAIFHADNWYSGNAVIGLTSMPWYKMHKRLWIVNGLQILEKGTKFSKGAINQAAGRGQVKGEGSVAQVPINAGSETGCQDSNRFIYCYRLKEVVIKRSSPLSEYWDVEVKTFFP